MTLVKKHLFSESLLESVMYNNERDLKTILNYLEQSYRGLLTKNLIENEDEFAKALMQWNIIVQFARSHNATIPVSLLNFFASHNAWMEFLLVCHIFSYPMEQVRFFGETM